MATKNRTKALDEIRQMWVELIAGKLEKWYGVEKPAAEKKAREGLAAARELRQFSRRDQPIDRSTR